MKAESQKINLLLVDDEEEFLATMTRALERRSFTVVCASSGKDALRLVNLHHFDAAVIDVKMPEMDGVVLFQRLKEILPGLPVIMLTAHGTISQAFETSKEGIFDYVAKPCDIDELAAKARRAAGERTSKKAPFSEPESPSLVRVLLVDDEVEILASLTPVLSRRGVHMHTASSGEEALEVLDNIVVDVVVLDIKMPGMDGIQTLQRIKSEIPDTEVILLTGHPEVDNAFQGVKLGAFDYMIKPPDINALADKIKEAFRARQNKLERTHEEWLRNIMEQFPLNR